ncbi:MAG: saccharopine dehydrogenase NADP-binding domain-containing protein [Candidatus Doudnabacteria bacterium]|nr:saccharopine dehydrogenase NADP-binding domain-containing protein [Candidatus Doudnabacteria bacterium]
MNYDFVVIGANGMQGRIVSRDLLESGFSVLLAATDDYNLDPLLENKKADFAQIDLRKIERVKKVVKRSGAATVINCAVDDYNLVVTKLCLDLGVNYIDLGSVDEEMTYGQFRMSDEFAEKKIIGITGMGSTPGINNVMLRYVRPQFDKIHTVHLGFAWNSNMPVFVPPFSLDAISWEFTEKAKVFENGKFVLRAPEECKINYDYREVGKLKTFYTAHVEHYTFYEYLKGAGIKNIMVCSSFPDHSREAIMKLIELGFTKKDKIDIEGVAVSPLDYSIEVLRRTPIPAGYKEKENIWLKVYGSKDGKEKVVEMDAIAGTLPGWEDATCNVDTGMPVSITAQMIKSGLISEVGVFAPEFVVPPEPFFEELGKRKIWIYENGIKINGKGKLSKQAKKKETSKLLEPVAA